MNADEAAEGPREPEKDERYLVVGRNVVDVRGGGVVYDGLVCEFSAGELAAIAWLLNHGHAEDDWETLKPHVEAQLARVAALAANDDAPPPGLPPSYATFEVDGAWYAVWVEPGVALHAVADPAEEGEDPAPFANAEDARRACWADYAYHEDGGPTFTEQFGRP